MAVGRWTAVSAWARHLELTETSPDHRVHDERGGDVFCWSAGQATPLAAGRRFGDVHWPTQPTPALSVQTSRWANLSLVKRLAASCGVAIPRARTGSGLSSRLSTGSKHLNWSPTSANPGRGEVVLELPNFDLALTPIVSVSTPKFNR